jgi:hypothetical protein
LGSSAAEWVKVLMTKKSRKKQRDNGVDYLDDDDVIESSTCKEAVFASDL